MKAAEYLEFIDFTLPESKGMDTSVLRYKRNNVDPILKSEYKTCLNRFATLIRCMSDDLEIGNELFERLISSIDMIGLYGSEQGLIVMELLRECIEQHNTGPKAVKCIERRDGGISAEATASGRVNSSARGMVKCFDLGMPGSNGLHGMVNEQGKSLMQVLSTCCALMEALHGKSFNYHYQLSRLFFASNDHVAALFHARRAMLSYNQVESVLAEANELRGSNQVLCAAAAKHRSFWFGDHSIDAPTQLNTNQASFVEIQRTIGNAINADSFETLVLRRIFEPILVLAKRFDNQTAQIPLGRSTSKSSLRYELFTPKNMNSDYRQRFSNSDEYFNESAASASMDDELTSIIQSLVPGLAARFDFEDNGISQSLNERNIVITLYLPRRATSLIRHFHRLQTLDKLTYDKRGLNLMCLPLGDDDTDNESLRLFAAYADNGLIKSRRNNLANYAFNHLIKRYDHPLDMHHKHFRDVNPLNDALLSQAHSHIQDLRGYTVKQLAKAPLLLLLARRLAQCLNNSHKRFFTVKVDIDSFKSALEARANANLGSHYEVADENYAFLTTKQAHTLQIFNTSTDAASRDDLIGLELELLDNCRERSYLKSAYCHTLGNAEVYRSNSSAAEDAYGAGDLSSRVSVVPCAAGNSGDLSSVEAVAQCAHERACDLLSGVSAEACSSDAACSSAAGSSIATDTFASTASPRSAARGPTEIAAGHDDLLRGAGALSLKRSKSAKTKSAKLDIATAAAAALGLTSTSDTECSAADHAIMHNGAKGSDYSKDGRDVYGVAGDAVAGHSLGVDDSSKDASLRPMTAIAGDGSVNLHDAAQCKQAFLATRSVYESLAVGKVKFEPQLSILPDLNGGDHYGPLLANCAYKAGAPLYYIAIDQKSLRSMDCYRKAAHLKASHKGEYDLAYAKISKGADTNAPYSFIKVAHSTKNSLVSTTTTKSSKGAGIRSALSAMSHSKADNFVADILSSLFAHDACAYALMSACGLKSKLGLFREAPYSDEQIARMWDNYIKSVPQGGNAPADYLGMSANQSFLFIYCMVYDFKRFDDLLSSIVYSPKYVNDLAHVFIHPACADTLAIELKHTTSSSASNEMGQAAFDASAALCEHSVSASKAAHSTSTSQESKGQGFSKGMSAEVVCMDSALGRDGGAGAVNGEAAVTAVVASDTDILAKGNAARTNSKAIAKSCANPPLSHKRTNGDDSGDSNARLKVMASNGALSPSAYDSTANAVRSRSLKQALLDSDLDDESSLIADTKLNAFEDIHNGISDEMKAKIDGLPDSHSKAHSNTVVTTAVSSATTSETSTASTQSTKVRLSLRRKQGTASAADSRFTHKHGAAPTTNSKLPRKQGAAPTTNSKLAHKHGAAPTANSKLARKLGAAPTTNSKLAHKHGAAPTTNSKLACKHGAAPTAKDS